MCLSYGNLTATILLGPLRRHTLLCSELKQLYVVITRARQRVWIYDEGGEVARQPLVDLWTALNLAVVEKMDEKLAAAMVKISSAEGWHRRGIEVLMHSVHHTHEIKCQDCNLQACCSDVLQHQLLKLSALLDTVFYIQALPSIMRYHSNFGPFHRMHLTYT